MVAGTVTVGKEVTHPVTAVHMNATSVQHLDGLLHVPLDGSRVEPLVQSSANLLG